MKACRDSRIASAVWAGVFLLAWTVASSAQQPSSSSSPAQASTAAPADPAAQIDQLLKKASELMNTQGHMKEAIETAQQALDLSQKLGDKTRTMQAMLSLGGAYYYESRTAEALEIQQQAATLAREIGNRKGLSRALNNSAAILRDLGRYEDSLSNFNQVMDLCRELHDLPMQWTASRNIGALYIQMGEAEKAEGPLKDSLRIAHELPAGVTKATQEISLETLGEWEMARQHYTAALNYFEQSLASKPENPAVLGELLTNMAAAHEKLGESQKSIELLEQAMEAWASTGTAMNPVIVSDLGYSQESLGQLNEALATEQRALALVHQGGGNPQLEWLFESRIAHIERARGRNEEALEHYLDSVKTLEHLRAGALKTESGRAGLLATSGATYAQTADLLYDLHREAEALEMAERGRARAFLDILAESRTGLIDELTPDERKREDGILARISAVQKDLWKENIPVDEEKKQKAQLTSAEDALESFHLEVRKSNPRYASVEYPEPINMSQIQNGLLDDHTALVEFLLGEKRSLVWVVTRSKLTTSVLPARKEIEEQAAAYRKVLRERASALTLHSWLVETHRLGTKLYGSLIQPIEAAIGSSQTLIVVPDGALGYLPFEALLVGSAHGRPGESRPSYLLERFAVVYGPSASALVTVQALNRETVAPRKTLLAFGDPVVLVSPGPASAGAAIVATRSTTEIGGTSVSDYAERGFSFARLPYTREEVVAISKLFPVSDRQVYLGDEAREETVKAEKLDEFRYIHFASHGFIDEEKPGRSGILLSRAPESSEDGVLQMGEIMRLKMNADLVTLSACSTGLGKLVSGEGILGLTRAFFYSGARNVTVSLWNVNDSATALLMKAYYENLKRGLPKSASLREAKLSLLRGKNVTWSQPYFWAAFVLVGEGK